MYYQKEEYDIDQQIKYGSQRAELEKKLHGLCSHEVMSLIHELVQVEVQYTVNGVLNNWKQAAINKLKSL